MLVRFSMSLSKEEFSALQRMADREVRNFRDQARLLIRLGLEKTGQMEDHPSNETTTNSPEVTNGDETLTPMVMERLLKAADVAKMLNCARNHAYVLMRSNLPVVKISPSVIRVRESDLEKFIADRLDNHKK